MLAALLFTHSALACDRSQCVLGASVRRRGETGSYCLLAIILTAYFSLLKLSYLFARILPIHRLFLRLPFRSIRLYAAISGPKMPPQFALLRYFRYAAKARRFCCYPDFATLMCKTAVFTSCSFSFKADSYRGLLLRIHVAAVLAILRSLIAKSRLIRHLFAMLPRRFAVHVRLYTPLYPQKASLRSTLKRLNSAS